MLKIQRLLLIAIITCMSAGCANRSSSERLDRLEERVADMDLLDLRLAHSEERLVAVEGAVGELREQLNPPSKNKKTPPREASKPAPQSVQIVSPPPVVKQPVPEPVISSAPQTQNSPLEQPGSATDLYFPPISGLQADNDFGGSYQLLPGGRRVSPPVDSTPQTGVEQITTPPVHGEMSYTTPQPAPPVKENETTSQPKVSGDKASYSAALALYEKHQYAGAQAAFKDFIAKYPNSKLAPNAEYWLGECYYSVNDFDKAIMAFKDVAGKYPSHPKAAAALLKAGYAYARMNDMDNAQFYWQILIDDFPDSQPAALARKRMGS